MNRLRITLFLCFLGIGNQLLIAQDAAGDQLLSLQQIFNSDDFKLERLGPTRWLEQSNAYTRLEASASPAGGQDLVAYDALTGEQRIIVPSHWLVPEGQNDPLPVKDYTWSPDKKKLLVFTNTQKVWRYHTRGDYWVLNLESKQLRQLGATLPESSLMFCKFSPRSDKVAYVSKHNIYVEDLDFNAVMQLTKDGTDRLINGTFDWAYEEEFGCRDGFRWSPDGRNIAYWQVDASDIRNFLMINNTDSTYSYTIPVQYPKVGQTPSSCRIGVVGAAGGETTWMRIKGDPRQHYLPRMM